MTEVNVLTSALAVQGSELNPSEDFKVVKQDKKTDFQGVLLYDLAKSKEEGYVLAKELAKQNDKVKALEQKMSRLQQANEELIYVRELNNQELLVCEKKALDSQKRIDQLTKNLQAYHQQTELSTKHVRDELEKVCYGHDEPNLSKRVYIEKQLQERDENHQKAIDDLQSDFNQQIQELKRKNVTQDALELALKRETELVLVI